MKLSKHTIRAAGKMSWLRKVVVGAFCAVAITIGPVVRDAAAEGPGRAGALFDEGVAAFARGDYRTAARAFTQAQELAPHGATLYNAGRAWQAAAEPARAADAFDHALRMGELTSQQDEDARRQLAMLEFSLGRLDVRGPSASTVSVAHVAGAPLPERIHVQPGRYRLRVRFGDGRTEEREVDVGAGAVEVAFAANREAAPAHKPPPPPLREPVATEQGSGGAGRPLGWVSLGTAGLASAGAAYFGFRALDAQEEFEASGYRSQDARDSAVRNQNLTNGCWAAAGVLGATGIVLLLTSSGSETPEANSTALEWNLGPGSVGLAKRF